MRYVPRLVWTISLSRTSERGGRDMEEEGPEVEKKGSA
jgi:hypothetical protein